MMSDITVRVLRGHDEVSAICPLAELAGHIVRWLGPYGDDQADTEKALAYALSSEPGRGGFVVIATRQDDLLGALIMLDTAMEGFIPRHHLVYVGVESTLRGQGIGEALVRRALAEAGGPVSLHVDRDNPAIGLYERLGFSQKYVEMRTG